MTRRSRNVPSAERRVPRPAVATITGIAAGGSGVSRTDGLVTFTPRTAPGDVAEIDVTLARRYARGTLRSLRTPSPDRVEPLCLHYTRDHCGGCQLQHLAYPAQLAAKGRIVADALARIGRREIAPPDVIPSPSAWHYRRKLTLALRRRGDAWLAGLHPFDAPGRVFSLTECPVTEKPVLAAWREVLAAADELPHAVELRGALRIDVARASLALEGGTEWGRAALFFERTPSLTSLWWTPEGAPRRRVAARGAGNEGDASFVQVNPAIAALLHEYLMARIRAHDPATLVDAYAGTGETALAVAALGARVTAIELDEDAVASFAPRLPTGGRAIAARVEDVLATVLPADVVVLNPPRAGVDARVTATLAAASPPPRALVYVSCDAATLARDVARLPAYRIASLRCFDMFPQTAHVETVCELVPEAA